MYNNTEAHISHIITALSFIARPGNREELFYLNYQPSFNDNYMQYTFVL